MPDFIRVLVALDVPAEQAGDLEDLVAAVRARVVDEAGYLNGGEPVTPWEVTIAVVPMGRPLTVAHLRGIYEVGSGL